MGEYDKLGLYFPARLAGLDGECFHYLVNLEEPATEEKQTEIMAALDQQLEPLNDEEKNVFVGEYWLSEFGCKSGNQVDIELDLGNASPATIEHEEAVINGILLALNNVSGIRDVVVNDGCDEYGDF